MVTVKSQHELEAMKRAGKIVADVLSLVGEHVKPGVTTRSLDKLAYDYITSQGASPSYLH